MQPNPLFAGLGPFAGLAQTGSQLATRGIQGLFGIKDPEIEARNAIAMAAQNPNDPATLQAAAQALVQAGKIDQAMVLAGQARAIIEKERSFGLQERQATVQERQASAAEKRLDAEAEDRAGRLKLSQDELNFKIDELKNRKDLTGAQIKEINARINELKKGDYSIKEQKGGIDGNTTVAFVAINDKPPFNTVVIPVTSAAAGGKEGGGGAKASVVPPTATWQYVPGAGIKKIEDK